MTATNSTQGSEPKESLLLNLVLNIIIPTVILMKFSGADQLGPRWGVAVALAFPITYGLMDFVKQRKVNFFSALGVVSVLLTGGIVLFELPPKYIAIKEATVPALLGIATLISTYTIPSITVMIIAMYYLFRKITRLTGLSLEEVFLSPQGK